MPASSAVRRLVAVVLGPGLALGSGLAPGSGSAFGSGAPGPGSALGSGSAFGSGAPGPAVAAAGEPAPDAAGLAWAPCPGLPDAGIACAPVSVPLDYRRPQARTITLTIARRPATDPARRRGVLVTTGGGPGGAGVPLVAQLGRRLPAAVLDRYDLVGVDQRFVGRSTPISCGHDRDEPGAFWVRPPFQPAELTEAQAAAYAADCAAHAGWALPHATTANAARDLDAVRAALGERTVSYLGGSYAAYVGAVYATLFPHRLDRLVLDSVVDPDRVWRGFERWRSRYFEAGLANFCRWTAAHAAVYRLGGTGPEVCAAWWALTGRLAAAPVGSWTADVLGAYTFGTMYDDRGFPSLARAVQALAGGREPPVEPPPAAPATPGQPADNATAASTAYRCGDASWPLDPAVYRRDVAAEQIRYPFVGGYNANITPCAYWPVRQDARVRVDRVRVRHALVVAATADPATPYPGSARVHRALAGSRLVTLDAQVHVPYLAARAACVDRVVHAYLATARLPARDVRCPDSAPPTP